MNLKSPPIETFRSRRWMLVDDNPEILSLMVETVNQLMQVEVEAFLSPGEALTAFQAAPDEFQYIITDLEMPGMSGFELCEQLRAISIGALVLLATGSHFVTPEEARARGFCGMLTKPFTPASLQREIALVEAASQLR